MLFPDIDISPLVALICYDNKGRKKYQKIETVTNRELEDIHKYFTHLTYDYFQWIKQYNEITIFRGAFRATHIKFLDLTILFISRFENISFEFRPSIKKYIDFLGRTIINLFVKNDNVEDIKFFNKISAFNKFSEIKEGISKVYERMEIEVSEISELEIEVESVAETTEHKLIVYEQTQPFSLVPEIERNEMTSEIIQAANKKAIISLLFSAIVGCISPSASSFIFPKTEGAMGELYAGDLEEHKILYVLESISQHPRAINEMLQSKDDIKVLDAGIVQIVVEDCDEGQLLIGMTTNSKDVMKVGYKLKIVKHVIQTMGFLEQD